MRHLLAFLLFVPVLAFANAEILESGVSGYTYVDPLNGIAYINTKTKLKNDKPHAYVRCQTDSAGKPVPNYFTYRKPDANGVIRTEKTVKAGLSCKQIMADIAKAQPGGKLKIKGCEEDPTKCCQEKSIAELVVQDPPDVNKCGPPASPYKCEFNEAATEQQVTIDLKTDKVRGDIKKCSGNENIIMIRDTVSDHALVNNLDGRAHCKLDKKRVVLGDSDWDGPFSSPYAQLLTSHKGGFHIGPMENKNDPSNPDALSGFFYDFKQKQWCHHVLPDMARSEHTCDAGYTGLSFPLNFTTPLIDRKTHVKGAVKLTVDESGQPVAYIGHVKDTDPSIVHPELDETKPMIRIKISNDPKEGIRTTFESLDNKSSPKPRRTLTVASTYSLGSDFKNNKDLGTTCDDSTCLRTPKTVSGETDTAKNQSCSNNKNPLDISSSEKKDLCYSCNGVTPGACTGQRGGAPAFASIKDVITSANYSQYSQRLLQCQSAPRPTVNEDNTTDTDQ